LLRRRHLALGQRVQPLDPSAVSRGISRIHRHPKDLMLKQLLQVGTGRKPAPLELARRRQHPGQGAVADRGVHGEHP
jgi:hypothetical protein